MRWQLKVSRLAPRTEERSVYLLSIIVIDAGEIPSARMCLFFTESF